MGACILGGAARNFGFMTHSPRTPQRYTNSLLVQPVNQAAAKTLQLQHNLKGILPALPPQLQHKQGGRWPGITAAEGKAQSSILMPFNIWEMQSSYNEKADIWQVCDCKANA